MTTLSCYEARLDIQALQAPEPGWEAVESHIEACSECRHLAERKDLLDASIADALDAATVGRSVRGAVREHLAHERRRTLESSAPRHALRVLTVPLVLAAVVLAIVLPRYATRVSENESSAQVFTPIQSGIAYPLTVDPP
jgi:predicted anti-sigma-YlaC factor YlaD